MSNETQHCGIHITKCALIVAFIGLICSCLSVISVLFLWYYIPSAAILAIIYAYVIVGILLEKPNYLSPALVVLSLNVFINISMFIALIIVGIIAPTGIDNYETLQEAKTAMRIAYFITAVIVVICTIYNIFALYVIHKARNYLISLTLELPSPVTAAKITKPFSFPSASPAHIELISFKATHFVVYVDKVELTCNHKKAGILNFL